MSREETVGSYQVSVSVYASWPAIKTVDVKRSLSARHRGACERKGRETQRGKRHTELPASANTSSGMAMRLV